MAAGAVAAQRVVEQREPTQFLRRELRGAREKPVVLARVRRELRDVLELVALQREQHSLERVVGLREDVVAKRGAKVGRVGRGRDPGHDGGDRGVCHLVRCQERPARLQGERIRAAVAIEPAGRRAFAVEEESRVGDEVLQ